MKKEQHRTVLFFLYVRFFYRISKKQPRQALDSISAFLLKKMMIFCLTEQRISFKIEILK